MTDRDTTEDAMHDDQWNGSRVDTLIARIVDREAGPTDFDGFADLVRETPAAISDLLAALRLDNELRAGVAAELNRVDRIELPLPGHGRVARIERLPRGARWTGWAAAAVIAMCWIGSGLVESLPTHVTDPVARIDGERGAPGAPGAHGAEQSPGLAFDPSAVPAGPRPRHPAGSFGDGPGSASLASDQVVGELPMQVVETRPAADGQGYEVLYVKRLLQRTRVGSVYSLGLDEQGQPAPVAVDPSLFASADSL
jgi:hypothetical protein